MLKVRSLVFKSAVVLPTIFSTIAQSQTVNLSEFTQLKDTCIYETKETFGIAEPNDESTTTVTKNDLSLLYKAGRVDPGTGDWLPSEPPAQDSHITLITLCSDGAKITGAQLTAQTKDAQTI